MKRCYLIIAIYVSVFANESFITEDEYAKMLYKNPRGVGCHHCHGEDGKGLKIVEYRHKNKDKNISAPNITQMEFERFKTSLLRANKIMPKYYLTEIEIKALYNFINNKKDENKKEEKKR